MPRLCGLPFLIKSRKSKQRGSRGLKGAHRDFDPPSKHLPDDVLAVVFSRLPPSVQSISVPRLSKAWSAWAQRSRPLHTCARSDLYHPYLPLWWLREQHVHGGLSDAQCTRALRAAAFHGQLANLVLLHHDAGAPWFAGACASAAQNGQLEVLRYLQQEGCPWDARACFDAAASGHLHVLRFLQREGNPGTRPWSSWACYHAARNGHLEALQWLHAAGAPWDATTYTAAAEAGQLRVLCFLRSHHCPRNAWACARAAEHGQLDALKWLRTDGAPWDKQQCIGLAKGNGFKHVADWASRQAP